METLLDKKKIKKNDCHTDKQSKEDKGKEVLETIKSIQDMKIKFKFLRKEKLKRC